MERLRALLVSRLKRDRSQIQILAIYRGMMLMLFFLPFSPFFFYLPNIPVEGVGLKQVIKRSIIVVGEGALLDGGRLF